MTLVDNIFVCRYNQGESEPNPYGSREREDRMKRSISALFLATLMSIFVSAVAVAQESQSFMMPDDFLPIATLFKQFKAVHQEVIQKALTFKLDSEVAFKVDVSGGAFYRPLNRVIRSIDQLADGSKYEIEFKKVPLGIRMEW